MKRLLAVSLGVLIAFMVSGSALGADALKVGVVDIQRFQKTSKQFQKIGAELKQKFDQLQKKLDSEKKALQKLEEEFTKQNMMLSLDAKEDKKRELEKKRRYYKYLYEDYTAEMKNSEREATRMVGKELEKAVRKIGEKEKFTLILEKRTVGLLYFANKIDITDKVVKIYDQMKK
jgi:outer membrane protein